MINTMFYQSVLGKMIAASDGEHLVGLYFEGQRHLPPFIMQSGASSEVFDITFAWLDEYFARRKPCPPLATPSIGGKRGQLPPLSLAHLEGTPFCRMVWSILLDIPYGTTASYGEIASIASKRMGHLVTARAVGQAAGRNPVSIIIPCHRVLGKNGALTGYAGGVEKKAALLEIEGVRRFGAR